MKRNENTVGNNRFDITDNILILACDVSKERINLYTETPGGGIDRVFDNKTGAVEKELRQFNRLPAKLISYARLLQQIIFFLISRC